jgi:NAD(P)H dehydrogenase (quinone)
MTSWASKGYVLTKIMVTGASGHTGRKTLEHLLKRKPATELVGLARDPEKAKDLAALGIEIRQGDYMDPASLDRAFQGVDRLMLTSTHAFTDRNTAHGNAIEAAVNAGVSHAVIMPIYRKPDSTFSMKEITAEDQFTEDKLLASGLLWTVMRHPPFLENLGFYHGFKSQETGVHIPDGPGKVAAATRDDLAAAHAAVLAESGHENKSYVLTGEPAVSFREIAALITKAAGKDVLFVPLSDEDYVALLQRAAGVPDFVAEFALAWVRGINQGEWQDVTSDLEALIGRKPKTATEYYAHDYLVGAGQ